MSVVYRNVGESFFNCLETKSKPLSVSCNIDLDRNRLGLKVESFIVQFVLCVFEYNAQSIDCFINSIIRRSDISR